MVGHETWTAPTTVTLLMQALTHSLCDNAFMYSCNAGIGQFACDKSLAYSVKMHLQILPTNLWICCESWPRQCAENPRRSARGRHNRQPRHNQKVG